MDEEQEPLASDGSLESDRPADLDELLIFGGPATRRKFLKQIAGTSAAITFGPALMRFSSAEAAAAANVSPASGAAAETASFELKINGRQLTLNLDPRT